VQVAKQIRTAKKSKGASKGHSLPGKCREKHKLGYRRKVSKQKIGDTYKLENMKGETIQDRKGNE